MPCRDHRIRGINPSWVFPKAQSGRFQGLFLISVHIQTSRTMRARLGPNLGQGHGGPSRLSWRYRVEIARSSGGGSQEQSIQWPYMFAVESVWRVHPSALRLR